MIRVEFTKMEGAGNDFVVIDATQGGFGLSVPQRRRIADRHLGIGCDQILVVERPAGPEADFRYRIFNADGEEVEQCGNGARCFVKFVHEKGLTRKRELRVETLGGPIVPRLEADGEVSVNMGLPALAAPLLETLQVGGEAVELALLSMGNPHAVRLVPDVALAPVASQGPLVERHARFPARVNAGFMQVIDRHAIRLRVYERGTGETLACGTGACAAAVSGIVRGLLDSPVLVHARGGTLTVSWAGGDNPVWMKGPAHSVFEGTLEMEG